jgi:hypothetical protein
MNERARRLLHDAAESARAGDVGAVVAGARDLVEELRASNDLNDAALLALLESLLED